MYKPTDSTIGVSFLTETIAQGSKEGEILTEKVKDIQNRYINIAKEEIDKIIVKLANEKRQKFVFCITNI
jgi:hypothetical protein